MKSLILSTLAAISKASKVIMYEEEPYYEDPSFYGPSDHHYGGGHDHVDHRHAYGQGHTQYEEDHNHLQPHYPEDPYEDVHHGHHYPEDPYEVVHHGPHYSEHPYEEHNHGSHYHQDPYDNHEYYDEPYDPYYDQKSYNYNHQSYPMDEYMVDDYSYHMPNPLFREAVYDFDPWQTMWDQEIYEKRINTEAEIMVALEAIRATIVDVDHDIDDLEGCIEVNTYSIKDNMKAIEKSTDWIDTVHNEIDRQRYSIKGLQKDCRRSEDELHEDRDFLVLYCQQFAFSKDMVGACADILTCRDTELEYRWEYWSGKQAVYYPPPTPEYQPPQPSYPPSPYSPHPHAHPVQPHYGPHQSSYTEPQSRYINHNDH